MCFCQSSKSEFRGVKVAQNDIVCYKALDKKFSFFGQKFKALWNPRFIYKKGVAAPIIHLVPDLHTEDISKGYHSHKQTESCRGWIWNGCDDRCIVECKIPKGTLYHENEYGCYVSSTIIIIKEV